MCYDIFVLSLNKIKQSPSNHPQTLEQELLELLENGSFFFFYKY